jgi:hypothetical protein
MISYERNCIFVHIPKTGGTSIESVIWPGARSERELWMGFVAPMHNKYQTGGLQHLLARQIRMEVGDDIFARAFKFTIVRNPWERAVSQFCYMARRADLREFVGLEAEASFDRYLERISSRLHVQWQEQADFVLDENGDMLVDFVGRFETLAADAARIFERVGSPGAALPHENKGIHEPYQAYYDDARRERVAEMYQRDIRLFGYTFGTPGAPEV